MRHFNCVGEQRCIRRVWNRASMFFDVMENEKSSVRMSGMRMIEIYAKEASCTKVTQWTSSRMRDRRF